MSENAPSAPSPRPWTLGRIALYSIHWIIIINFAIQIAYGAFMTFVVMAPKGVSGPLWAKAANVPFQPMVVRRLYASETWIAICGLAIYLALTEIGPRLQRDRA